MKMPMGHGHLCWKSLIFIWDRWVCEGFFFKFVVLWVYYFSHKPLQIGGLHAKGFQFLSLFLFSLISFAVLSKLHGWVVIYNGWVIEFSLWILPTLLIWKVKMIFQNLFVETRAHLQCKFELLDVNSQKFNKSMEYGNITLKFMKNWQFASHVVYFGWKL